MYIEFVWLYCITCWNNDSLLSGRDPVRHAKIHSCLLICIMKEAKNLSLCSINIFLKLAKNFTTYFSHDAAENKFTGRTTYSLSIMHILRSLRSCVNTTYLFETYIIQSFIVLPCNEGK